MEENKQNNSPTIEETHKKVEEAKRNYYEENLHNKRVLRVLKAFVYVLTATMLILGVITVIVALILEKNYYFTSRIAIPVITIIFGIVAILLTQINKRISKTSNLKGDTFELIVGIVCVILGIIWLFTNIF
jgi:cytochrome c biogenesis protein CcdA